MSLNIAKFFILLVKPDGVLITPLICNLHILSFKHPKSGFLFVLDNQTWLLNNAVGKKF